MKLIILNFFLISSIYSQFTLYKGNDYLRIASNVTIYYNHRFYNTNSEDNFKKNRFGLKDARLQIKGELRRRLKYQIELDFAKFKGDTYIDEIEEIIDSESSFSTKTLEKMEFESFLIDAYASIKIPLTRSNLTFGFFKVPFSRNSMGRSKDSPWIDRADLVEDALSRRDLGVMLTQSLLSDRLKFDIGIFNGRGDITKNNDSSGNLEFVSRLDYTFGVNFDKRYGTFHLPGRLKIENRIDLRHTPIPTVGVGIGYKLSDKEENIIYDDDHYWPLSLDGQKEVIGFDFGLMFRGLSIQFDLYKKHLSPNEYALDTDSLIYQNGIVVDVLPGKDGYIDQFNGFDDTDYDSYRLWGVTEYQPSFNFGGKLLHINYYFKNINLVKSFRWEEINPNSLILNNYNTNLGFGLCYLIDGMLTSVKLQYIHRLPKGMRINDYSFKQLHDNIKNDFSGKLTHKPWKESELRIGIQFLIR
tara:strand:- start:865 stop:2277 length:1413 start_codon:yes stop_codon:yes gene_type:complete